MVSRLVLKKSDFPTKDALYTVLSEQMKILLENGYAVAIYSSVSPADYLIIEYSSLKPEIGGLMPFWLDLDESKAMLKYQREQEYARCQYTIDNKDKIEATMKSIEESGKSPDEVIAETTKAFDSKKGDGGNHCA